MKRKQKLHLIGNAHLDPVWLWRWQQGYAEVKATFRSALDRMKEFPEFIFTCACAAYYQWVEENNPEMFEEIKERVREGRWVITGGWWIQPDCNIPSGESFVRHGLYSQRYFKEKFGLTASVGYNVDSFGHNGTLPQILKKSGMDYYIFMRPGDHEKNLPGNLFWWESNDGSRVLTFKIPYSYGNWGFDDDQEPVVTKILKTDKFAEELGYDLMSFYGVGNHGGGPTIENIKTIKKLQTELPDDHYIFSSPNRYFFEISEQKLELPVVKDDLQHHASGCYSAHSKTKKNNRRAEHRLVNAEKFAAAAQHLLGLQYPRLELEKAWKKVLFNQFHDIMGGCSIREAYDDAEEFHGQALTIGSEVLNSSVQKLSWAIDTMGENDFYLSKDKDWKLWEKEGRGTPFVVFNPLSWDVCSPVQVEKEVRGITDENGYPVELQKVRASQTNLEDKWDSLFMSKLPAMGYRVYWLYRKKSFEVKNEDELTVSNNGIMENSYLIIELDCHSGYIKRMYDKINKIEVLSSNGAVPVVHDEYKSDTWAHGIFEFRNEIAKFSDAVVQVLEKGPLRARLRVTSRYNMSVLQQDFILYSGRKELEVWVKLDWREKHKLLKLSFPVRVDKPKAVYEIPYGFITRPVNGEEETSQQWLDVSGYLPEDSNKAYGLALLNDSKYSFDVTGNDMGMTVVRSPIYADHFGNRDEFCEFMDQDVQEFKYILVPHEGKWDNAGIVQKAYELNVQPVGITETYHKGTLPLSFKGISIDKRNVIASAFKLAEDEDGYILRCYECAGIDTRTEIEIPFLQRKWRADFGKCEIKTFHIPLEKDKEIKETNLIEF
jgi:Alpha-mannosidase